MTDLRHNLEALIRESIALDRAGVTCRAMREARLEARRALMNATHGDPEALTRLYAHADTLTRAGDARGLTARRRLAVLGVSTYNPQTDTREMARAFDALREAIAGVRARQRRVGVKA